VLIIDFHVITGFLQVLTDTRILSTAESSASATIKRRCLRDDLSDLDITARMMATSERSIEKRLTSVVTLNAAKSHTLFNVDSSRVAVQPNQGLFSKAWRIVPKRAYDFRNALPQVDTRWSSSTTTHFTKLRNAGSRNRGLKCRPVNNSGEERIWVYWLSLILGSKFGVLTLLPCRNIGFAKEPKRLIFSSCSNPRASNGRTIRIIKCEHQRLHKQAFSERSLRDEY
jgi:hypothetical protein